MLEGLELESDHKDWVPDGMVGGGDEGQVKQDITVDDEVEVDEVDEVDRRGTEYPCPWLEELSRHTESV